MTPLAQDLFTRAHELNPAERDAFLARACGDDTELHLEVQRLLVDAERADSFFGDDDGSTLGAEEFSDTYAEQEGDAIGPYKLRQQIGEGGFGTVWMAEQSVPISRMVALKVIKAGMDTKQVLARFEAERQALAMMDHPNIAKVLDAGATTTGRPYFAMELVKGIPITQFCDESGLGTTERLVLFRDVCSAINHAHQKGIIHRDIKPSNVMVTLHGDKAVVKVIDFGIAKATQGKLTDQTLFTRFEQFVGTPVYMSPEQASLSGLDIDTRSDIYALGILLYELLVGKPPFDGKSLVSAGYEEMRRIIREVEPTKPSSRLSTVVGEERTTLARTHRVDETKLSRLVEPDLDWIVMKAIEKDRSRRYETANAFSQDIRRFLDDEAVTATPPSAGYQFRKFAKRHKAALRVGTAVAAVLVAATVVSSMQAIRATRAEELATERLGEVAAERDAKETARRAAAEAGVRATREAERAQAALQDAEGTSSFLVAMFANSQPGAEKGGRELKVVDVLDRAVEELEANKAIPDARRVKLQGTLARTYSALGLHPAAIGLQEQVRDNLLATYGPEPPTELWAWAMSNLALSYHNAGRRDEALKMSEELLALSRKTLGPEHPDTIMALNNLATSYYDAGRRDEALEMQEMVLALSRRVHGAEHPATLLVMHNLATCYQEAGRRDDALEMQQEALALCRKVLGSEHPQTLATMANLAVFYFQADRHAEAIEMREKLLTLHREVLGPEHPATLDAMTNLAASYDKAGRQDEALQMMEVVLALSRKMLGSKHPRTLMAAQNLALTYGKADRLDEALQMVGEALATSLEVNGPEHPDTRKLKHDLALIHNDFGFRLEPEGKPREAIKAWRKAIALDPELKTNAPFYLGVLLERSGNVGEAFTAYLTAVRNGQMRSEALGKINRILEDPKNLEPCRQAMGLRPDLKEVVITRVPSVIPIAESLPLLAESSTAKPEDTLLAMKVAALQAWSGMGAEHAATSRRMLDWVEGRESADDAERVAKITCLHPVGDATMRETALGLARRALTPGEEPAHLLPWRRLALGMAEYRDGHHEEAAKVLRSIQDAIGDDTYGPELIEGTANFYRTMSLLKLGRNDEARALFTATEATMKALPKDDAHPLAGGGDHDDLVLWLACREARALLESPGESPAAEVAPPGEGNR